jgi:hydrogenase/urease accessory protein HupE
VKTWLGRASLLVALAATPAGAHELRPGYLEMRETTPDRYRVLWKQPARGDLRLALDPAFPASCQTEGDPVRQSLPGAFLDRMTIAGEGGLGGKTLAVAGLEATLTDVLVRIQFADGRTVTELLKPGRPGFTVPAAGAPVAVTYLLLGVEHILFGIDHLLFVLGLLLLVGRQRWRLLQTITAFTAGHSVSLALATLGAVDVPAPPLEAAIALSIVFLAAEIVRARRGEHALTARQPGIVAGAFGLVHGVGFASALIGLGLPSSALPTALLLFNVGVEIGQVVFVGVVLGLVVSWRALDVRWPTWTSSLPIYAMGIVAAVWFAQRLSAMITG